MNQFAELYETTEYQFPGLSDRVRLKEVVRGLIDGLVTGLMEGTVAGSATRSCRRRCRHGAHPERVARFTPEAARDQRCSSSGSCARACTNLPRWFRREASLFRRSRACLSFCWSIRTGCRPSTRRIGRGAAAPPGVRLHRRDDRRVLPAHRRATGHFLSLPLVRPAGWRHFWYDRVQTQTRESLCVKDDVWYRAASRRLDG